MSTTQQPDALHYAEILENFYSGIGRIDATGAAAELRRLHADVEHKDKYAQQLGRELAAADAEARSLQRRVQEVGAVARREHERADSAMRAAQPAIAMLGEQAELRRLSDCCPELNLSNYGPDDVGELNGWAIEVSQCIDSALAALPAGAQQPGAALELLKFYGVTTDAELIAAQARHIERLQARLPQPPSFAPQRVREG